jgi:hypothetical protein
MAYEITNDLRGLPVIFGKDCEPFLSKVGQTTGVGDYAGRWFMVSGRIDA